MPLKTSQKQEIANRLEKQGFKYSDFTIDLVSESKTRLKNKQFQSSFDIELYDDSDMFTATYSPGEASSRPSTAHNLSWYNVLDLLEKWALYVKEEIEATDPWQSEMFDGNEAAFTPTELESLDKAIDASFQELLDQVNSNGSNKTLEDILETVTYLKTEARKTTKNKWLDLFQTVVATLTIEWGINSAISSDITAVVLRVLFETAKPVLKIVAST